MTLSSKMVQFILVNGLEVKSVGTGYKSGPMELATRECGEKIKHLARVNSGM
jgi:hypothetical protein